MKKYLLLLLTMLTTTLGAWAENATIAGGNDSRVIITTKDEPDLASLASSDYLAGNWGCNTLSDNAVQVSGTITQAGLDVINSMMAQNSQMYYVTNKYLYLNEANLSGTITSLPAGTSTAEYPTQIKFAYCILPAETEMPTTIPSTYEYVYSGCESDGTIRIHVNQENASISQFTAAQISAANTIIVTGSAKDNFISSMTDEAKAKLAFDGSASITTTSSSNVQAQLEAYLISKGKSTSSATTDVVSLTISGPLTSEDVTYLSTLSGLTTLNLTGVTSFGSGVSKSTINAAVSGATVIYPAAYTVSGCDVTVNALGSDMSTILTEAKAAVVAGGQSHICTLTVIGELKNADLAVLGDAAMTGATRIDLSGGTLATGASIDNLQLPSSLTSLVLPKDQTVSSVLAGKLEAAGNVNYAYSPSSDSQRPSPDTESSYDGSKNTIADYVWIVKAGGLEQAFTNEEWLRNSYYIKVASSVALNTTDVNFDGLGANKPSNYLFLDLSASNLTTEVASSYVVTDDIGYRIILPDNWSNADMAIFAALPRTAEAGKPARGNLAAVYSYEGSKLNILVIENASYNGTALRNPRIVRPGTNAIEILQGTYSAGSHPFGPYSEDKDNDGVTDGIISAINNAQESIKSVIINIGATANSVGDTYTFTNPNMTYLSLEGVKSGYGTNEGATLVISGANALKTLNLKNGAFAAVTATGLTSLETVNMTGTTFNGAADFSSNSNLTTLTTASDTDFKSSLSLTGSGLTSFATSAKVTGDIYLNASTSLTSLDLTTTQFQNTTSKIHIHETNDENDNNPIPTLNSDGNKTISVTNNFNGENNVSPRICPFTNIADNISEAAASGDATLSGCTDCKITYDATKGVATVHAVHAGHFAELMKTLYAGYPQGTTFKFDKDCVLNLDDLKALCGKNTDNDMTWRSNFYYVDLYDVPATPALCANSTGLIYNWITWMRENDRQVKGLILPKDHTQYGSGTTLIQDGSGTNTQLATCSEFIAYYKTKDDQGNDLTQQTFVGHVYNQSTTAADAYQASYEKMLSLVDAHTCVNTNNETVPEVKTNADIVLITSNSATKLNSSSTSILGSTRIETINNEMVGTQAGKGSIYAYPNAPGAFATACASTNLQSTPTELLQINGTLTNDDITAINGFTDGPRVLDLRYATSAGQTGMITKAMLEALTNTHIEYILLPEGQTKDIVCGSDYSDLTSLKAVISSTSTNCVAYVKAAGSLAEARYLATGGSVTPGTPKNIYSPAKVGLTSVTLAGNLNAADIGCNLTTYHTDVNGHWKNTSGDQASVGLSMETGITSIDLADAVFVNKATTTSGGTTSYADMNLSWAGLANLSDIKLPTSTEMKDIPESCCEGLASLKELCIPHNYTKIDNAAFLNTILEHITTTDASGALIDNGANTYTLSANLQEIGSDPGEGNSLAQCVFPQNRPVFDCYVLATKTPKCYKNAFPANMLYGWGGFKGGDFPYCRDKYVNGSNYFCVLRFPSQESYDAVKNAEKKDTSYDLMKKQYTDVTKVYSKKEQTGAVDANGDEITWPTFSELRRAYNQATDGLTWNRWVANYDGQQEVNGGENIPTSADGLDLGHYNSSNGTANNNLGDYTFENYEGWHQFTLSQATYVEPDEKVVEEKVIREYEDAGWFTICLPYDLTEKQVIEWLGVPQSEGNVICKYDGAEVDASSKIKIPDIRQLTSVTRHTSTGGSDKNKVTFRLTTNLYNSGTPQFMNFDLTAEKGNRYSQQSVNGEGSYTADTKVCLKGGIPYIIYAYKRKDEKIKGNNIGQYIMTRYGDQFKQTASCINHGDKYYEYLGGASDVDKLTTLKFAKPYEEHQIVAMNDAQNAEYLNYDDNGTPREYRYAFVGQFWNQNLPKYCFYQSKGTWYRNGTDNNYQWSAYKCVIMAVPTITMPNLVGHMHANGNFRNNPTTVGTIEEGKSFYPTVEDGTTDKLNGTLKIVFADGRDDDDFPAAAARYSFAFDDDIVEYDDMGNEATAIDMLDGEDITPLPNHYKVYNMSGQYVGNSVNGLAKGMYVVNGKKYVIK